MRNIFLALVIMATTFSFAFAQTVPLDEIQIKVNGLVCDFCARNISKVFSKVKEVSKVDVDLSQKVVTLALVSGSVLEDERIGKLIRDAGYQVVSINRGGANATP